MAAFLSFANFSGFYAILKETDLEKQKGIIDEFVRERTPNFLNLMETFLDKNGGRYFVGTGVSKKTVLQFCRPNDIPMISIRIEIMRHLIFVYFLYFKLTWADLAVFTFMEMLVLGHARAPAYQNPEALNNHQKLQDFSKRVAELPNIKAWLAKRPKTPA